jgi:membrane protease YdiL (CAAX protease family)
MNAPSPAGLVDDLPSKGAVLGLFTLTFLATLLAFLPGQLIQTLNLPFGLVVTSLGLFGAAGFAFPVAFNLRPGLFTGLGRTRSFDVALGFGLGLANLALANFVMGVLRESLPADWSRMADDTTRLLVRADRPARIVIALAASVAAPVGEELFFRGWLQPLLATRWRPLFAIGLTAVVFSFVHLDPVGFLPRVELGLLFGFLRYRTGRLMPAMAAHAAHNLASVAGLYLADDPLSEIDQPFDLGVGLAAAAGSAAATWLLMRLLVRRPVVPDSIVEAADGSLPALHWRTRAAVSAFTMAAAALAASTLLLRAGRDRLPGHDLLKHPSPHALTVPNEAAHSPQPPSMNPEIPK